MTTLTSLILLLACGRSEPAPEPPTEARTASPPEHVAALAQSPGVTDLTPDDLRRLVRGPVERPRVVNFWATWCGPCVAELPEIDAFAAENPDVDVVLVSVDLPRFRDGKVIPFLERAEVRHARSTLLDVPDPAGALPGLVPGWPDSVPYTLVLGPDDAPVARFTKAITGEDLSAAVAAIGDETR